MNNNNNNNTDEDIESEYLNTIRPSGGCPGLRPTVIPSSSNSSADLQQQQQEQPAIEGEDNDPCVPCAVLRKVPPGGMLYGEYLMLDQLLQCQQPFVNHSNSGGTQVVSDDDDDDDDDDQEDMQHPKSVSVNRHRVAHDEHLFIVTHQAYELWFKQIIFELDSVRELLIQDHNRWKKINSSLRSKNSKRRRKRRSKGKKKKEESDERTRSVSFNNNRLVVPGATGMDSEASTNSSTNGSQQQQQQQQQRQEESINLLVTSRLSRITLILKLLVDQVQILETMTPLDFMDFRANLKSASGFQSLQFRLIENKLGVKNELRTNYGKSYYIKVFEDERVIRRVKRSESEPSLLDLIGCWLERTPGLDPEPESGGKSPPCGHVEDDDSNEEDSEGEECSDGDEKNEDSEEEEDLEEGETSLWSRYRQVIHNLNSEIESAAAAASDPAEAESLRSEFERKQQLFESIFSKEQHDAMRARGDRRFSHRAFQGALLISLYRDEPRFNQPYQILNLLVEIDFLITKWRYNHVQLVLRTLGSQTMGTGGSSGYHYLRSTLSDRYKCFVDICNLATFIIPRNLIPPLTPHMKKRLSVMQDHHHHHHHHHLHSREQSSSVSSSTGSRSRSGTKSSQC